MASNSGTFNRPTENERATIAFRLATSKRDVSEIIVSAMLRQTSHRFHRLHHQSAKTSEEFSFRDKQVRRKFESTTRYRQFAMNHANDTIATHNSRISERWWLSTRNNDHENVLTIKSRLTFNGRRTMTRSNRHSSTSEPQENVEATALGLICNFPFPRGCGGIALYARKWAHTLNRF